MNIISQNTPLRTQPTLVDQNLNMRQDRMSEMSRGFGNRLDAVSKLISGDYEYDKSNNEQLKALNSNVQKLVKSQEKTIHDLRTILKQKAVSNNLVSTVGTKQSIRDFGKKDDSNSSIKKDLDRTADTLQEMLKWQKEHLFAKMGNGFLDMIMKNLPKALAVGGLLGYLMTGKQSFLMDAAKGLKPFMKTAENLIFKLPVMAVHSVGKFFGVFEKMSSAAGKLFAKGPMKAISTAAEVGKGAVKPVFNEVAKRWTLGGKFISKTVAEDLLKEVPKEAGMFGKLGGILGKTAGKLAGGIGKIGAKEIFKRVPILGSIMALGFAFKRFKDGDIAGGFMELGSGAVALLDLVAPGVGTALSLGMDAAILLRDIKKSTSGTGNNNSGFTSNEKGDIPDKLKRTSFKSDLAPLSTNDQNNYTNKILNKYYKNNVANNSKKPNVLQRAWNSILNFGKSTQNSLGESTGAITDIRSAFDVGSDVHLDQLNATFTKKMVGLASDFKAATGKSLRISSGFRTYDEQKALYEKYLNGGNYAVNPDVGMSRHQTGLAMDVHAAGMDDYTMYNTMRGIKDPSTGKDLISKYNLINGMSFKSSPEPWHFQAKTADDNGDMPVNGGNLRINTRLPNTDKKGGMRIAKEDLESLASMIGKAIAANTPKTEYRQPVMSGRPGIGRA